MNFTAHPKTVGFVSHCGMFGMMESLYHRVPILGLPIFADQMENAKHMQDVGIGITITEKDNLSWEEILDKLNQVIDEPK